MQMTLGEKLIDLRKQNKMTQDDIAVKLKVTRQTISNWELNQTAPDLSQAKELSKLFGVSLDELTQNDIKEILTERVSNVEKLAGLIYKILKIMLVVFVSCVVLTILAAVLFSGVRSSVRQVEGEATLNCSLNGEVYTYGVKYNKNNEIIEAGGDAKLNNILDLDKLKYSDQVVDKITSYFETNGGSCE